MILNIEQSQLCVKVDVNSCLNLSLVYTSFKLSKEEERKRQEKLARERIEAARQGRSQGLQQDDDSLVAVDTEDPASLQEAIARDLDRRHRKEMEFFMQVGTFEY